MLGNINKYVLFAFSSLNFKGAQGLAGPDTGVHGGNVGVNNVGGTLSICSNYKTHMDDGSQVVADVVHGGGDNCDLYDVYANDMTGYPPIEPRNSGPNAFTAPILSPAQIPALPTIACNRNAPDFIVAKGATRTLPPGVWGEVRINDEGTLVLDGDYTVCDFENGRKVKIRTTDRTVVKVAGSFGTNDNSYVGPSCTAQFLIASQQAFGGGDNAVHFGRFSELHGHFYAPNGDMNLGHGTSLNGTFWAGKITSNANVNAEGCPTPTTPTTPATTVPPTNPPTIPATNPPTTPPTTVPATTRPTTPTTPPTTVPPTIPTTPPTTVPPTNPPTTKPTTPPTTVPPTTPPTNPPTTPSTNAPTTVPVTEPTGPPT